MNVPNPMVTQLLEQFADGSIPIEKQTDVIEQYANRLKNPELVALEALRQELHYLYDSADTLDQAS